MSSDRLRGGVSTRLQQITVYRISQEPSSTHSVLLPIRGTASLVLGITELTMFINTVRDNRIVTPR